MKMAHKSKNLNKVNLLKLIGFVSVVKDYGNFHLHMHKKRKTDWFGRNAEVGTFVSKTY